MSENTTGPCGTCGAQKTQYRCHACYANKPCGKCGATDRFPSGTCRACRVAQRTSGLVRKRGPSPALMTKPCVKCGEVDRNKHGQCRACARIKCRTADVMARARIQARDRARRATPEGREKRRDMSLRIRYGVTAAEYDSMLTSQRGRCDACGDTLTPGRGTNLDHDHTTGAPRALVCPFCNRAVGNVKDSPLRAEKIAAYLRRHAPRLPIAGVARALR
jgi:Recombination endonuclease VII